MTSHPLNASPWQVKETSATTRAILMLVGALLLIVLLVSFFIVFGVGMSLLRGTSMPDSFTANLIAVTIAAVVCVGSLAALLAIWPYTRGPVRFTPAYPPVAPTALGQPFEVRFQRYLWGRSMRGKDTAQFTPEGLTIAGHIEPHALFQLGVVLALTFLPAFFFNFGLGIIPALLIAYYVGRKKISRTIPYAALHGLAVTGRQISVVSDAAPKRITLAVAPIDGERLYRELLPRFPAALGGWQG